MKRFFRYLAILIGILFVSVAIYYTIRIINARNYTTSVVIKQLRSGNYSLKVSDLTEKQLQILLKVEDPAFYEHHGVDFWTAGAGITTLTQSLVKEIYYEDFQPGLAKIEQTLLAIFVADPLISKNDQLSLFLNIYHFASKEGQQIYGFEQAARAYFNKPLKELTEDQYIALVAMIMAPGTFNVSQHPDRNAERVARIKKVVSGEYQPKGLFDLTYGKVSEDIRQELLPFSYYEDYYK